MFDKFFKKQKDNSEPKEELERVVLPLIEDAKVTYKTAVIYKRDMLNKCIKCYDIVDGRIYLGDTLVAYVQHPAIFEYLKEYIMTGRVVVIQQAKYYGDGYKIEGELVWDGKEFKLGSLSFGKLNNLDAFYGEKWFALQSAVYSRFGGYSIISTIPIGSNYYIVRMREIGYSASEKILFARVGHEVALYDPEEGMIYGHREDDYELKTMYDYYKQFFRW